MTSPIKIQTEGPLTLVSYHGKSTDLEYAAYLEEMTRVVERNKRLSQKLVVLNDTTRWIDSNANQRKMQADWIEQNSEIMRTKTAGVGFVISSAFVRGGLTAILWLTSMPCPYRVMATLDEGLAWAKQLQGSQFPEVFAQRVLRDVAQERQKTG